MKCPFCAYLEDKVVDSRESREGDAIRRRRECLRCERRITSYERIDEIPYKVVKKVVATYMDANRTRSEVGELLSSDALVLYDGFADACRAELFQLQPQRILRNSALSFRPMAPANA